MSGFNPITVRLMGRRGLWLICPACHGKRGQVWKVNSSWTWRNCETCGGKGEVPNDNAQLLSKEDR